MPPIPTPESAIKILKITIHTMPESRTHVIFILETNLAVGGLSG